MEFVLGAILVAVAGVVIFSAGVVVGTYVR